MNYILKALQTTTQRQYTHKKGKPLEPVDNDWMDIFFAIMIIFASLESMKLVLLYTIRASKRVYQYLTARKVVKCCSFDEKANVTAEEVTSNEGSKLLNKDTEGLPFSQTINIKVMLTPSSKDKKEALTAGLPEFSTESLLKECCSQTHPSLVDLPTELCSVTSAFNRDDIPERDNNNVTQAIDQPHVKSGTYAAMKKNVRNNEAMFGCGDNGAHDVVPTQIKVKTSEEAKKNQVPTKLETRKNRFVFKETDIKMKPRFKF